MRGARRWVSGVFNHTPYQAQIGAYSASPSDGYTRIALRWKVVMPNTFAY